MLLTGIDPDLKVYRIFKKKHFFKMLKEKRNALVRPSKWQDPFENFILRSPVRNCSDGTTGLFSFHDDVYGQCWSLSKVPDTMWLIYPDKKNGVQIGTTVGKLLDSLNRAREKDSSVFIGRVQYQDENGLREFSRTIFKGYNLNVTSIAESLLVKRDIYEYEHEARLIYINSKETGLADDVYEYNADLCTLIDEVIINPCIHCDEYDCFKEMVMNCSDLNENQIKRSSISQEPEGFIVEFGCCSE